MITPQQNPYGRKNSETPQLEELLSTLHEAGYAIPRSEEAEKAILSALMWGHLEMPFVTLRIKAESFYFDGPRIIFTEMLTMHHEGIALDPIMLTNRLREQGKLEIIGGAVILTEIYGFIQVPSHAKWYLDKVVEDFRLRQELHAHLLSASECFKHRTHGSTRSVDETLNH